MKRDPKIFISHALACIEDIERFSSGLTEKDFKREEILQNAIIRKVEVLGEACRNVPTTFRKRYSTIPWKQIVGTRDKLIHQYFGVDLSLIWDVIKKELPLLKKQFEEVLELEDK